MMDKGGSRIASTTPVPNAPSAKEDCFKRIQSGQDSVISNLSVDSRSGQMMVLVCRAVRDSDQLLGVLLAGVDIKEMARQVMTIHEGKPGISVLSDTTGRIVARSIPTNVDYGHRLIRDDNGPVLKALATQRDTFVPSYHFYVDGVKRLGATVFVPELGWTVSETVPHDQLYASAWRIFNRDIGILLMSSLLAILLGLWLARDILRPLSSLKSATEELANGNLSARSLVIGNDELAITAQTFDQMAEKIERLEQERARLIQVAAHELRNPLAGVKGILGLLRLRITKGKPAQELLHVIDTADHEIDRTTSFLNEFVDTFRIQHRQLTLAVNRVDLQVLLANVLKPFSLDESTKHPLVFDTVPAASVFTNGDRNKLEQVFRNLVENAIKYSPVGGQITVSLLADSSFATVRISDSGIGIPKNEIPHVFDTFFRGSNVRSHDPGGAGLGLYICHEIVTLHHGDIWVESTEGCGSTFSVRLPLAQN
jgi:signal transduction histidine kinase